MGVCRPPFNFRTLRAAEPPILFQDFFAYPDGNLTGQGGWTKRPGGAFFTALVVSNTVQSNGVLICSNRHVLPHPPSATNWQLGFTASLATPVLQQILEVGFKNTSTGGEMYVNVTRDAAGLADLYWVDNDGTLYEAENVPFADNTPHWIEVFFETPAITVKIDGHVRLVVPSPTMTPSPATLTLVEQAGALGEVITADNITLRSL